MAGKREEDTIKVRLISIFLNLLFLNIIRDRTVKIRNSGNAKVGINPYEDSQLVKLISISLSLLGPIYFILIRKTFGFNLDWAFYIILLTGNGVFSILMLAFTLKFKSNFLVGIALLGSAINTTILLVTLITSSTDNLRALYDSRVLVPIIGIIIFFPVISLVYFAKLRLKENH